MSQHRKKYKTPIYLLEVHLIGVNQFSLYGVVGVTLCSSAELVVRWNI